MIESTGDRDPVQPGRQPRFAAVTRQRLEGRKKNLLYHVLGVLSMPDDSPDHRPDVVQMDLDQAIERIAVPLPRAGDHQLLIDHRRARR